MKKSMEELLGLIEKSTSPFHTVKAAKERLIGCGFEQLQMEEAWELKRSGRYVVTTYDSSLFAFVIGRCMKPEDGFRMGGSHGDFPGFALKADPEITKDGYMRLNVEAYGGVNYMSWLDRPLSIAGKVVLRSKDVFHPEVKLVDFQRPLLTIPNIAVHIEREMNKGMELKVQKQLLPLFANAEPGEKESALFKNLLARELDVDVADILDYELRVYATEKGETLGMDQEFLSSPRLDNLTSVDALCYGISGEVRDAGVNLMAVYDHEEIGSRTKQGAASAILRMITEKIYDSLGFTKREYEDALSTSLLLSVDVSHALHPAYTEKYDPVLGNVLNHGLAIKQSVTQSYATDSELVGVIQQICEKEQISYQKFYNHSDQKGGGTLGNIASALVPVRTVDVGVPILAMHSARELMGVKDQESLRSLCKGYYSL